MKDGTYKAPEAKEDDEILKKIARKQGLREDLVKLQYSQHKNNKMSKIREMEGKIADERMKRTAIE